MSSDGFIKEHPDGTEVDFNDAFGVYDVYQKTNILNTVKSLNDLTEDYVLFSPSIVYALFGTHDRDMFSEVVESANRTIDRSIPVWRTERFINKIVNTNSLLMNNDVDHYIYLVKKEDWGHFQGLWGISGFVDRINQVGYFFGFGEVRVPDKLNTESGQFVSISYIGVVANDKLFGFYPIIGGIPAVGVNAAPEQYQRKINGMFSLKTEDAVCDTYGSLNKSFGWEKHDERSDEGATQTTGDGSNTNQLYKGD